MALSGSSGLCVGDGFVVVTRVDREQQLSFFDALSGLKILLGHDPRHLGTQFDFAIGLDFRDDIARERRDLRGHGCDDHLGNRGWRRGLLLFASGQSCQEKRRNQPRHVCAPLLLPTFSESLKRSWLRHLATLHGFGDAIIDCCGAVMKFPGPWQVDCARESTSRRQADHP